MKIKQVLCLILTISLMIPIFTACKSKESESQPEVPDHIAEILDTKHTLKVREDGSFKVLVIADVQSGAEKLQEFTHSNIVTLVRREEPDLVLFLGDNTTHMHTEDELRAMLTDMTAYIEAKKIPWAHVYGNHDDEWGALSKEEQQKVYESFEYCVSRDNREELYGVGNYVLPILSSDESSVAFNLFAFDSGSYLSEEERMALVPYNTTFSGLYGSTYDYIRPDQIQWYNDTSIAMEEYYGHKIPAMAYFHIPLQENYTAWQNRKAFNYDGEKREYIGASPINSGLFTTMLQRGDVKAIVTGHDHINDYAIDYCGIKLCASATVGNEYYYADDMLGGRVFVFNENTPNDIQTYMSYTCERKESDNSSTEPLKSGTALDFESEVERIDVTAAGYSKENYQEYHGIKYDLFNGNGVDGSKAFGVTRSGYSETHSQNTVECRLSLDSVGTIGDNKYLRVWLDLRGENAKIDFGEMALGVCVDRQGGAPHITSGLGNGVKYYYLEEGTEEWTSISANKNGHIGANANASVKGYCGWFAVSLNDLYQTGSHQILQKDDFVTDMFIYFTLADKSMVNEYVYIDDVALVDDYTQFT